MFAQGRLDRRNLMLDRLRDALWIALPLLALTSACAMDRPAPQAPQAPEQPASPGYGQPTAAPPAEPAPTTPAMPSTEAGAGGTVTGGAEDQAQQTLQQWMDLLAVSESLTLSAGRDCGGACRALRSMSRAAGGICELSPRPDSTGRCKAAEDSVRHARTKVRDACGSCSDGTSVDPNAPVE